MNKQDNVPQVKTVEDMNMKIHELSELFVNEDRFAECSSKTKSTLYRGFYDGYEAAQSSILGLEAENKKLRNALEGIKEEALRPTDFSESCYIMIVIADEALNSKEVEAELKQFFASQSSDSCSHQNTQSGWNAFQGAICKDCGEEL